MEQILWILLFIYCGGFVCSLISYAFIMKGTDSYREYGAKNFMIYAFLVSLIPVLNVIVPFFIIYTLVRDSLKQEKPEHDESN